MDAVYGGELMGRIPLDPRGLVSLRGDPGFLVYGYESKRVCIGWEGGESYFDTQNFGDGTFSWGLGWGLELNVHRGRIPGAINLAGKYHQHGVMK